MSLDENRFLFNVIEVEWSPEFSPKYMYSKKFNKREVEINGSSYDLLDEIARKIAEDMVGTKSDYDIISQPEQEGGKDYFRLREGLSGNSETKHIISVRRLHQGEMSYLGRRLILEIEKRKQFLDSPDN